jgi:manganese/zinc/iron transport system permease protein
MMTLAGISFSDPTILRMVGGMVLIGLTSAIVGVFAFLRKKALVGDAVSHSILPGVALAYLYSESKSTWLLMTGAVIAGWLAITFIDVLGRTTKLRSDANIAIVLSIFFSFGLVIISYIQGSGKDSQSGLSDFLFGKVAALSSADILTFAVIGIALFVLLLFKFRVFYFLAFNQDYMKVRGYRIWWNDFLISTASILAITMGIQAVGVVLMSALLIIPVVTARMLTFHLVPLLALSGFIGVSGSIGGAVCSSLGANMPTGPWVIVVMFAFTMIAVVVRKLRESKPSAKTPSR